MDNVHMIIKDYSTLQMEHRLIVYRLFAPLIIALLYYGVKWSILDYINYHATLFLKIFISVLLSLRMFLIIIESCYRSIWTKPTWVS